MKMVVLWDVALCSLIDINGRFRGTTSIIRSIARLNGATSQKTAIFILVVVRT
jgi:hypothetical protein